MYKVVLKDLKYEKRERIPYKKGPITAHFYMD